MTAPAFDLYKYPHGGRPLIGPVRRGFIYAGLAAGVLAGLLVFPFGFALLLVPLVARFSADCYLQIGPRYLLCSDTIVYYGNVRRLILFRSKGVLVLHSANGTVLMLERDKFPTSARKADKIAKNRAAKFEKASSRIIERVNRAAPGIALEDAEA